MARVYHNDFAYRLMQFALAIFFLILGIQEVAGSRDTSLLDGMNRLINRGGDPTVDLIIGILAIGAAALLLLGVFQAGRTVPLFSLIILIYWGVRLVYIRFISEVSLGQGAMNFQPSLEEWLLNVSGDIIILCALWLISRGYSRD